MRDWSVEVTWEAGSHVDVGALEELAERGGVATLDGTGRRVSTTVTVAAYSPGDALDQALKEATEVVPGEVIAGEVMTTEEQDRRLAEPPFPELVGIGEIAEILGVSRQRASTLQTSADFPGPVAVLKAGPIYRRADLGRFLDTWQRKPGRPARAPRIGDVREWGPDVQSIEAVPLPAHRGVARVRAWRSSTRSWVTLGTAQLFSIQAAAMDIGLQHRRKGGHHQYWDRVAGGPTGNGTPAAP